MKNTGPSIGTISLKRGDFRRFDALDVLTTLQSALQISMEAVHGCYTSETGRGVTYQFKRWPKLSLVVPLIPPIQRLVSGNLASGFDFRVVATPAEMITSRNYVGDSSRVDRYALYSSFLMFFEREKQALKDSFGHPNNYPPTWQFARILRNSIAHGERISFNSPNSPSGTWRGLSYDQNTAGRAPFQEDVGIADLILLMLDLSEELNRAGADPYFSETDLAFRRQVLKISH